MNNAIVLPEPRHESSVSLEGAIAGRRSVREYSSASVTLEELSQLLWAAQGITGAFRGLRAAPSAGETYPMEVYAAVGRVDGLEAGLYRYIPGEHRLETVATEDSRGALNDAGFNQGALEDPPLVIGITGVVQRTADRFGEGSERYVVLEAGHVSQNIYLQAYALGLGTVALVAFAAEPVSATLGLAEGESPIYLMPVGREE